MRKSPLQWLLAPIRGGNPAVTRFDAEPVLDSWHATYLRFLKRNIGLNVMDHVFSAAVRNPDSTETPYFQGRTFATERTDRLHGPLFFA